LDIPLAPSTGPDTHLDFLIPDLYRPSLLEREWLAQLLDLQPLANQSTTSGDITGGFDHPVLQDATLCTIAIRIIRLCNKKDLSMLDLDTKLRHGYRKARSPLEGCRVDNWVLLTVLAEIIQ
jgi:arsenic resistance protein ArsH